MKYYFLKIKCFSGRCLNYIKLNIQAINEELEQHETCLCLCIEGIPLKNMKQESVLDSVKNYFELAEFNIFDGVVDRVHRIGRACKDDASN